MRDDKKWQRHYDLRLDEYIKKLGTSPFAEWANATLHAPLQRSRYIATLNYLDSLGIGEKRVLDVGASPFYLGYLLKISSLPRSIACTDIAPDRIDCQFLEEYMSIHKWDIEEPQHCPNPIASGSYEIILFLEIFEHLRRNPIEVIESLSKLLASNGVLILSVPNLYHWPKFTRILAGRGVIDYYQEYDKLRQIGHMGHVRLPSIVPMRRFMDRIGLSVNDILCLRGNCFRSVRNPYAFRGSHLLFMMSKS